MLYRDYLRSLVPSAFLGPKGDALLAGIGTTLDGLVDQAKAAVKQRFPQFAAPDALPLLGQATNLERGPGETEAQYALRLAQAFAIHRWAGKERGALEFALGPAGFPGGAIIRNRDWSEIYGGVPPDTDATKWARFWVVLPRPDYTIRHWDDGDWADGTGFWPSGAPTELWDSSAPPADIARARRLIQTWKPSRCVCMGIFITGGALVPDAVPGTRWQEESAITFGGLAPIYWRFEGPIPPAL